MLDNQMILNQKYQKATVDRLDNHSKLDPYLMPITR
jgi:hypothetical protein